jgi:hypothetical protein
MKPNKLTTIRPLILLFVFLTAFFVTAKNWLTRYNINQDVLIIGNLLLFVVTIVSCFLFLRSIQSSNPNSFVRAMYGSFILKFFLIAIVAFVYIIITKKNVNKPALITCMVLYMIYTFIEVSVLLKLMKKNKNA